MDDWEITAHIIDVNNAPVPKTSEAFFVDTNVWKWVVYVASRDYLMDYRNLDINKRKISLYSRFFQTALKASAKLHYSVLILTELAHVIEDYEKKMYHADTGVFIEDKTLRYISSERKKVVEEVTGIWAEIDQLASCVELTLNKSSIVAASKWFETVLLDGYDILTVEAMKQSDIVQIITDDKDFTTVPDIKVFTANEVVIAAARKQGKLVSR